MHPTPTTPPTAPAATGRRVRRTRREGSPVTLLAVPALVWYLLFTLGPLLAMFYISGLSWPGMLAPRSWAGWENFRVVLDDPLFWQAVRNSAIQIGVVLPVMIVTAFMVGYYLTLKPRGHRLLRVVLFTPALISASAKAMMAYSVLAPNGMLNGLLDTVGLGSLGRAWLADTDTALACIMAIDLWNGIGFTAVLFAARLGSVPGEIYEAAELDGSGHWRRMWRIAFPVTKDYVGVTTMLQFLWILFSSAQNVLLLTQGGPGNATTNLSFLVYNKAFVQSDLGYSQAAGVLLFVVGLVGMLAIRRLLRQNY
ncbi:ABC transporter permease subunit [Streptomyces sp. 3MP-14]|uniref:ABC transporter permease subunit n=1 Tax=Streptomyces mimosae TaxID=2586635 RepID=A0A5N5ZX51_9ACTN|nr:MULTISPECIES: sugar ABC transporter permease [Streptomyces]KAB8160306.1 ABC transporter permease subunit [Streptomyces mimosae]KAB8172932.1 ABC transporter permease subunit [Streptomyces sp. 3MP-14]